MLIKRVSPPDLDVTKEVKYMLTADIQEMAQLVGIHPERMRNILCYGSDAAKPFYGVARPSTFFTTACKAKRPRALSLSQVDIRAQDGFRLDASGSFVIMPIYVMRPSFVGNLESTNGVRYELIPNLLATVPNMGNQSFYQYVNLEQPFRDFAHELENSEGFEIHHELMGWDLVMLPDEGDFRLPDNVADHIPTPKEEENVIFDYGFGLYVEYVYTSDMHGALRIDSYLNYKDEVVYSDENRMIIPPVVMLQNAVRHLDKQSEKPEEAYALAQMLIKTSHYPGIGYRRS